MAGFDLEGIVKRAVEKALNKPVCGGKTITEWAAIGMATSWVSVEDRLPEEQTRCLAFAPLHPMMVGTYTPGYGWIFPGYYPEPTHWMPLPEPPEEVSADAAD